eukprot:m.55441 g.55441  ORF g.55441 m.55441 type:complete len:601 (+) comp34472_c0_seq5:616-2418(+)
MGDVALYPGSLTCADSELVRSPGYKSVGTQSEKAIFHFISPQFCSDLTLMSIVSFVYIFLFACQKYLDTCSSAIAFFVVGYGISQGITSYPMNDSSNTVQFFFKFTFASNTATIIGGTLCGQTRKMRTIAIPIYAFMISGFIHPMVARWIWGGRDTSSNSSAPTGFLGPGFLSPYQRLYCRDSSRNASHLYKTEKNMYVVDFAGGGAVHLLGGIAGLVLMLVLKLDNKLRKKEKEKQRQRGKIASSCEEREEPGKPDHFLDWMYPEHGGSDLHIEDSALGVLILWTTWFAFNCGSTESVESSTNNEYTFNHYGKDQYAWMYYNVPGRIAINMILCTGSAGLVAVCIAGMAQLRARSRSTNVNEIANGILGALVAITSGCPFVTAEWAIGIGVIAVFVYHFGCWIEYKFNIDDTARVFPVHGMCGLWSMIAPGILIEQTYVNQAYEGLCYCSLLLPEVSHSQRFSYQLLGSVLIAVWSALTCGVLFLFLNFIPAQPFVTVLSKIPFIGRAKSPQMPSLVFKRGLLFTCPDEYVDHIDEDELPTRSQLESFSRTSPNAERVPLLSSQEVKPGDESYRPSRPVQSLNSRYSGVEDSPQTNNTV